MRIERRVCLILGASCPVALPHPVCLQVDYATGELDRLKIIRPATADTKLFIGIDLRLRNAAARFVFSDLRLLLCRESAS